MARGARAAPGLAAGALALGLMVVVLSSLYAPQTVEAHCPNMCNGHGECEGIAKCSCWSRWTGGDCSLRKCPTSLAWTDEAIADETAHQPAECSNRGLCDHTTGICTCMEGFEGLACDRMSCPNDCSGHGRCRSMKYHAANAERGYSTQLPGHELYTYNSNWDKDKVWGCECDPEYKGYDCSLRVCPVGDDPLTTGQVNEIQVMKCIKTPSANEYFTLTYKGETTAPIATNANAETVQLAFNALKTHKFVQVFFKNTDSTTVCNDVDPNPVTFEFDKDFGDVAHILVLDTDGTHPPTDFEWAYDTGNDIDTVYAQTATKEADDCSNRGSCDDNTGVCTCYTGYETSDGEGASGDRGDCGYPITPITECPGTISCSGHGVCEGHPTYRCTCDEGWTSGDCSKRTCPCGKSWFDYPEEEDDKAHAVTECSDMGHCNRETGECQCREHFEGSACERSSCPRDENGLECYGHGKCINMKALAEYATLNGDATDYSYGFTPNDKARWDYDMMYGCFCDVGYEGYDCSERTCPTGDDITTVGQHEIVVFECNNAGGATGTFSLLFRQQQTASLTESSTTAELEAALEALSTIDDVEVNYHNEDVMCTDDPVYVSNYIAITFWSELGDLPEFTEMDEDAGLIFTWYYDDDDSGDSSERSQPARGTTEDETCSDRGLCNHSNGVCECFTGFGSSDGAGNRGGRGDCGFRLPIVPVIPGFSDKVGQSSGASTGTSGASTGTGTTAGAFQVVGP